MNKILNARLMVTLACGLATLHSGTTLAGDTREKSARDAGLDQLECRTLLRLSGDERAYTLLYFHGFVSGKTGQLQLNVDTMSEVTDRVVDHCIDHPGAKLLPVFEKLRAAK